MRLLFFSKFSGPTFIPFAKFSRTYIYSMPYDHSLCQIFQALRLFPSPRLFRKCMEREAKSKLVFPKNRFRAVVTMEGKGGNPPNQILTEPSKCSPKFADLHTALKLSKQAVKLILNGQLISKRLFGIFHSSKN